MDAEFEKTVDGRKYSRKSAPVFDTDLRFDRLLNERRDMRERTLRHVLKCSRYNFWVGICLFISEPVFRFLNYFLSSKFSLKMDLLHPFWPSGFLSASLGFMLLPNIFAILVGKIFDFKEDRYLIK
jgi:hypothetical protein